MKAPRKCSLLLTNQEIGDQKKSQWFMEVKIIMIIVIIILIIIEIKIIIIVIIEMMIRIKIIEENVMGRRRFFILNGDRLKNFVKLTVLKRQN